MKLKLLLTLFAGLLLTGCGPISQPDYAIVTEPTNDIIEVESITTDEPVVNEYIGEPHMLRYSIYPYSATDKTITVDDTYLNNVAKITVDDFNHVFIWGEREGTGVVSIITSNNKFVSYSIKIFAIEESPDSLTIHKADDVAEYFNEAAAEYDIAVHYNLEGQSWNLLYSFGVVTEISKEILGNAVHFFKQFLPNYLLRYNEKYIEASILSDATYTLIMVNPTISTVAEIWSYVENEELLTQICIKDIW